MVEIPSLLHVHNGHARTIPAWESPGIVGVDALRCGVEVTLVPAPRVIAGVECWRRARVKGLDALHLGEFVKPVDKIEHVLREGQSRALGSNLILGAITSS